MFRKVLLQNRLFAFNNVTFSSRVDFSQPKQDVTTYFDQIDFDKLANSFVIKCNHGCKWQYIIKDKEECPSKFRSHPSGL